MKYSTAVFVFLLSGIWTFLACDSSTLSLPESVSAAMQEIPEEVDYTFHVKPILSDRCFVCHGPDQAKIQAGLRLDVAELAYAKNAESSLYAIVPGKPHKSEAVRRILSDDPDMVMPTPNSHLSLTDQEKAILIRWIEQGAVYKPHWAYSKVEKPALPKITNSTWPKNEIDYFIGASSEKQGLQHAPEASKVTLIRRVYFDLIGLPPTPQEVDTFVNDNSPNAFEKVVDKLLASSHYGEQMAVAWLDLARYADTHGYQDDGVRTMWPYRDWVIKAFNENLPYDKFVTWQLAGDLLPSPTTDMLVATGFNRNHQQSQEGGIVPEEYRTEYVADRVNTFGKAFLGLTTECARCHDHKYDPISQKDYFSLFAFFNNNNENGQIPYNGEASPSISLPTPDAQKRLTELANTRKKLDESLITITEKERKAFEKWLIKPDTLLPRQAGITAHFTFDERKGVQLNNLVNPTLPARAEGDSALTTSSIRVGRLGTARLLQGENPINFEPPLGHYERHEPFTVSIWLKFNDEKTVGSIIHKSNGVMNGYRGWNLFRESDGNLRFTLSHVWPDNAIELITQQPIPLKKWVHIALSYDGKSKAKGTAIYIDGQRVPVQIPNDNLTQSLLYGKNKSNWYVDRLMIGRLSDQFTKDFEVDELKIYARNLAPIEIKSLYTQVDEVKVALKQKSEVDKEELFTYWLHHISPAYQANLKAYAAAIEEETTILNTQIDVMVMRERKFPRKTYLLKRGVYDAPDYEVTPATPDEFFKMPSNLPKNRLGLAQWLLHPDHPLFSRVVVNRFWQHYFGKGLVKSVDDFGNQGDLPTHPELLDWLAVSFRESGWDIKALQKKIVLSATYRQSSVASSDKDPNNAYYTYGPMQRLSAEQSRDNALAVSGLITNTIGGPSVYPYQPDGLWEALATRNTVKYQQSKGDSLYRRSLYTFWKRSSPPPMMLNFDAAERHTCSVKRQSTSTPLQALVTLNDPQFVEAARVLAEKGLSQIANGKNNQSEVIDYFYKTIINRAPRPKEVEILTELYHEELKEFTKHPQKAKMLLNTGEYPIKAHLPSNQVAAYTMVVSTLMNYDEFLIKR